MTGELEDTSGLPQAEEGTVWPFKHMQTKCSFQPCHKSCEL